MSHVVSTSFPGSFQCFLDVKREDPGNEIGGVSGRHLNDVIPFCVLSVNERARNLKSVFAVFEQVKLLAGGEIVGKGVYPVKATVMEGDLPINTNACGTCDLPCFSFKTNFLYKIACVAGTRARNPASYAGYLQDKLASSLITCLILLDFPCVPRPNDLK